MMQRCEAEIAEVLSLCEGAYSPNTLRGYRKDLECFKCWCGQQGFDWLPAEAETVADYVDELSTTLSVATVKRRLCAIRFAHFIANRENPISHSSVHLAVRRALLKKRRRPAQSLGLTRQILQRIADACPKNLIGRRDAALISVGYDTLCRSSELAAMRIEHVRISPKTTLIFIPLSKSDPFGDGRWAHLSPGTSTMLQLWIEEAEINEGAVFRGLHTRKVGSVALNTSSIRRLIKSAARRANLPEEIVQSLSGHSMRIGAAQDMLVAGFELNRSGFAGGSKP